MVFLSALRFVTILLSIGAASGFPFLEPRASGTASISTSLGPTSTIKPSITFALGGPPAPPPTQTSIPLEWSQIITSNFTRPDPLLNKPANITFSNVTHINTTFWNVAPIQYRNPLIFSRDKPVVDNQQHQNLNKRGLPAVMDWRNHQGLSWLTTIQYQGGCGSCWAFAATALVETMVRIQHGMWSKRSEEDLQDSLGVVCSAGYWAEKALTWAAGNGAGIADEACDPYNVSDDNYMPCADRSGRALRLPAVTALTSIDDQKKWLAQVGPITASFNVYEDFKTWKPINGPYKWDGVSDLSGSHAVLIVGYDDNQGCWIIRNSWSTVWGDSGYGLIAYGQVTIDNWTKYGITNVNPDAWTRKRHHNGNMYQSGNGATHRNFELVRASSTGFTHVWREGEAPFQWSVATNQVALDSKGNIVPGQVAIGQPIITGTSFNRDFEVLYWADGGYLQHWYYSQNAQSWYNTGKYGYGNIAGYPGFVQTTDSNFVIVVRTSDGTLREYSRSAKAGYFIEQGVIANNILQSGPALVQSNIGQKYSDPLTLQGNLYTVAVLNSGQMQMFWRSTDPNTDKKWIASETFGNNIPNTPPVMVQDFWRTDDQNTPGGFQLCVAVNGQVQHWQRVNTNIEANPPASGGAGEWGLVYTFGSDIKHVWSLIHGSFSQSLELVVEDNSGHLWHWEYTGTWAPIAMVPGP